MEVLVFKTNIYNKQDVRKVKPVLEDCKEISGWNVDTMDVDKVLRIEAVSDIRSKVEKLIINAGFSCEELE